ncbi:MAG: hypothetical protein JST68_26120 [Bacteroidetes bacterium]|nr:hypothetical protein [Bacteroidota bacterium]
MNPYSLLLALLITTTTFAQSSKTSDKDWDFQAGINLYHPLKYFNMFSGFGTGIDVAALHPIAAGLSVGGRINYGYFFGRSADPTFTSGNGDHFKASHLYDFFGEASYKLPSNIVTGLDLGYGIITFNGESDGSFAEKIYLGYEFEDWNVPMTFAAFYEQTSYHKNAGIRATVRL